MQMLKKLLTIELWMVPAYISCVAIVFMIVAGVHGWRIWTGAELFWNDTEIPMWVSWIAMLVSASFSFKGFRFTFWIIENS